MSSAGWRLHPAEANYSLHGNGARSSHQKHRSVHQAIILMNPPVSPSERHSHTPARLAAHYAASLDRTGPDPLAIGRPPAPPREFIMTREPFGNTG